jgi:hypothetical protein
VPDLDGVRLAIEHTAVLGTYAAIFLLLSKLLDATKVRDLARRLVFWYTYAFIYGSLGCAGAWWYLHDSHAPKWLPGFMHWAFSGAAVAATLLPLMRPLWESLQDDPDDEGSSDTTTAASAVPRRAAASAVQH